VCGNSLFDAASTSEAAALAAARVCVRCSMLQNVVEWCSVMQSGIAWCGVV